MSKLLDYDGLQVFKEENDMTYQYKKDGIVITQLDEADNVSSEDLIIIGDPDTGELQKMTTGEFFNYISKVLCGTCSTSASTAVKVVECSYAQELATGMMIFIEFSTANTADAPTLNVNSLGAKNIYSNGATVSSSNPLKWAAGTSLLFIYNGTYWVPMSGATVL